MERLGPEEEVEQGVVAVELTKLCCNEDPQLLIRSLLYPMKPKEMESRELFSLGRIVYQLYHIVHSYIRLAGMYH